MNQSNNALEERIVRIKREEKMSELLKRLQQEDRLFEYNVPVSLMDIFDDDDLIGHLQEKVYGRDKFVVENPEAIKKYAQTGDAVFKKGDFCTGKYVIKKGAFGIVRKVRKDGNVKVRFNDFGDLDVSQEDLLVTGRPATIPYHAENFDPPIKVEELKEQDSEFGHLMKKHKVIYDGEDKKPDDWVEVPDGTPGLVIYVYEHWDMPLYIVWKDQPGVTQNFVRYYEGHGVKPTKFYGCDEATLVIPNRIDFSQILDDVYNPNLKVDDDIQKVEING